MREKKKVYPFRVVFEFHNSHYRARWFYKRWVEKMGASQRHKQMMT